jgi:tricorn protease
MRSTFRLTALLLVIALTASYAALSGEARLARHPAPAPDGSELVVSWQGDLWRVPAAGGAARPLTTHPATDRHPVWSDDGRWIAFASDRHGQADVFVVPADGSDAPRRLTHASWSDRPVGFSPDGTKVLFTSRRALSIKRMPALYEVALEGGTPVLVQEALGRNAEYAPDGVRLAFTRGGTKWWRRGYRGAADREIWLRDADGGYRQLTDFAGDDDHPSWVEGRALVFLSARNGRKNLYRLDLESGETQQLTFHEGTAVRAPSASADGRWVAYEFEDQVYIVRSTGGETRRVRIEVPADRLKNQLERHVERSGAGELAVHPKGELAAVTVEGEVFVTALRSKQDQEIAPPPTVQITETAARESDVSWTPDGKALILATERDGGRDLMRIAPVDEEKGWLEAFEFETETLVASGEEEHSARLSPDGSKLAFVRGLGTLLVRDMESGEETVIFDHWSQPDYEWSPDGRFLAYSAPDLEYNNDVWIVHADGSERYNVSRHPDQDVDPHWSADGKRLVWTSKRHADTMDVHAVWLAREDHEKTPEDWLAHWKSAGKKKGAKEGDDEGQGDDETQDGEEDSGDEEGDGDEEAPAVEVVIDFDGLWERVERLTSLDGDEGSPLVADKGKTIVFTADPEGERDLYAIDWKGGNMKRLTSGGQAPRNLQLGSKGKTVFYLDKGGQAKRVGISGKPGDPIPYEARFVVDRIERRRLTFDEAWRWIDDWFYDPNFHGIDWEAQREKYRPWVEAVRTRQDFADVVNLMLGELNASHMGYYPSLGDAPPAPTGLLGVTFDPAAGGPGILVSEVLRDGPAARTDVALEPGDRILAIDGWEITPERNVYEPLAGTAGQEVVLTILDAGDGEERRARVTPISAGKQNRLRYDTWVRERREIVEKESEGRLGYIHIQGMSMPSFEELEHMLYAAAYGKDGLLVDVRSNGGGWTTDYVMAVLNVRRHAYTVPRGSDADRKAYPQVRLPLAAWTKPAAALCDQESYSNAEIFSRAFKTLDRGPLIGYPTFGAVISTGGTPLLDGGFLRLPFRGWYEAGTDENMENNPAMPDVVVEQPPRQDLDDESDAQLSRAVDVLLEHMKTDPRRNSW